MSNYHETKKVRRIASVIYILVMIFIVVGTILSEQQKTAAATTVRQSPNP